MKERKSKSIFVITWMSLVIGLMVMSSCVKVERDVIPYHVISENVSTCEDLIEWIYEDVENDRVPEWTAEMYIENLEKVIEDNRKLLK